MTKKELNNLKAGDFLADNGVAPNRPFAIILYVGGDGITIQDYETEVNRLHPIYKFKGADFVSLSNVWRIPTEKEIKLFKLMMIN